MDLITLSMQSELIIRFGRMSMNFSRCCTPALDMHWYVHVCKLINKEPAETKEHNSNTLRPCHCLVKKKSKLVFVFISLCHSLNLMYKFFKAFALKKKKK